MHIRWQLKRFSADFSLSKYKKWVLVRIAYQANLSSTQNFHSDLEISKIIFELSPVMYLMYRSQGYKTFKLKSDMLSMDFIMLDVKHTSAVVIQIHMRMRSNIQSCINIQSLCNLVNNRDNKQFKFQNEMSLKMYNLDTLSTVLTGIW